MQNNTTQHELHMQALIWKSKTQKIEEILEKAKLDYDVMDKKGKGEEFPKAYNYYLEKIEHLKHRISHFENKLSVLNECDTSHCDTAFFDESEAISIGVKNCMRNVKEFASEISN